MSIVLISYGTAALSFLLLCFILMRSWRDSPVGPAVMAVAVLSVVWGLSIAWGSLLAYPPVHLIQATELLRDTSFIVFLLQLNSLRNTGNKWVFSTENWSRKAAFYFVLAAAIVAAPALPASVLGSYQMFARETQLTLWLLIAIAALVLVEQLYRNAAPQERWATKFLCLGIAGIFLYDFFMYAEALLFRRLDADFWRARGFVNAIAIPWLTIGIARHRESMVNLHISRNVVFHSVTLVAAGTYLLCMAVIGYFIKYQGGDWGGVLQLAFIASGITVLSGLLLSGRLRANVRVFLSKNFFSYRYDYREEWVKFTQALANPEGDTAYSLVSVIANLVNSEAGLLYCRQGDGFRCVANWEMPPPPKNATLGELPDWLEVHGWIIDFLEWRAAPNLYQDLKPPNWILETEGIWLAVPLIFGDSVIGVALLKRSELKESLDWEDRDLLKTAGHQAAAHLAQKLANDALIEARQFDAFNRLSAYVVHDLKNILAQQSLLIANADRHKHNPAFVDDMLNTVKNSVTRMQRLMDQMRSGERSVGGREVDVQETIEAVIAERSSMQPVPTLATPKLEKIRILADPDRLATVFSHLIQNAQEATNDSGTITVSVQADDQNVAVVIKDSGEGMSTDFVLHRLFRPFDSTKGLTGMGIGAFESRDYVRQLGGDIDVESHVGEGSTFTVHLPLATQITGEELATA